MAKKDKTTRELFKKAVPEMPEGYYSADKPNPNLRAFVEQHLREKPYEPTTDQYDVPSFNEPVEGSKATAIYNMHTYWSMKPHDAIRQYIRHFTEPGDMVLDPFSGSGSTALAALLENRKAIAIDRSPAATFITKSYCTPVDATALQAAFEQLKKNVESELDWLYETKCDRCGGRATTGYTVYSQVFRCPRCLEKIVLFDCKEVERLTAAGKPKTVSACPRCYTKGHEEEISTQSERFGAIPVLVSYKCEAGCKPIRSSRRHDDPDLKKRQYFEQHDLARIREIASKPLPHWIPPNKMMNVDDDSTPWGDEWREGRNFRRVADLFTKRNLWALSAITERLEKLTAQRAEWQQQALDYSQIFEFYVAAVNPKPKARLEEILEDYCYQTDEGNWRPPLTDAEKKEKSGERHRAVRRMIQRLCKMLEAGDKISDDSRPATPVLAEWIRHCRRAGLHAQGRLLYERGGLDPGELNEQAQADVEEDYQVCVRNLARLASSPASRPNKQKRLNI